MMIVSANTLTNEMKLWEVAYLSRRRYQGSPLQSSIESGFRTEKIDARFASNGSIEHVINYMLTTEAQNHPEAKVISIQKIECVGMVEIINDPHGVSGERD